MRHQYLIQISPDDALSQGLEAYEVGGAWGISAATYGLALLAAIGIVGLVVASYRS